ncbi:MAG: YkgJ family cysteine cluster protein [Planctomycetota bacterium]|jgi:Fe-S-cluster containining protein
MIGNSPVTASGKSEEIKDNSDDGFKPIELEFEILGETLRYSIEVADRHGKLADIVPIARSISSKVVEVVEEKLCEDGQTIPCCKGCSTCCYYLTPLSIPEVFRLSEELLSMPADTGRVVLESYLGSARKILDNMSEDFDEGSGTLDHQKNIPDSHQVTRLSSWYAGLKLACPFLSDGLCMIYENRPTVCRENMVTESAEICKVQGQDGTQAFKIPVSIAEGLAQLAAELEQSSVEAVMLPLALPWAEENRQRGERTWPMLMMVEKFVNILKEMASRNSAAVLEPA